MHIIHPQRSGGCRRFVSARESICRSWNCFGWGALMRRQSRLAPLMMAFQAVLLTGSLAYAQVEPQSPPRRLITQAVDERNVVTLQGNTRPELNATSDRGRADDFLPIEHIQLQLQLPAEKEQELGQRISDLQDAASPNYHKWLTPDRFKREFSLAPEDMSAVTSWLES